MSMHATSHVFTVSEILTFLMLEDFAIAFHRAKISYFVIR